MKYINYNQNYENEVVELWNKCLYFDQITIDVFRQKAIFDDNFDSNLCWLALDSEKVVGFIMATKRKFPYLERGTEPDRGWINVMFVDPKYRRQSIGKNLYLKAEEALKEKGTKEITLAMYSPSYFFGGVDEVHYPEAELFFKEMGYDAKELHYSMGMNLTDFKLSEKIKQKKVELENKGYKFTRFNYNRCLEMLEFLKNEFGGGWKRNALLAMRNNLAEELIIMVLDENDKICGFSMSAIDGNLERFGPIGVAESKRNDGIGSVLLNYSFECMHKRGVNRMFFMTTDEPGKRYYERNGLEVIRTIRNYRKTI